MLIIINQFKFKKEQDQDMGVGKRTETDQMDGQSWIIIRWHILLENQLSNRYGFNILLKTS
jgi:hypothetical protein